MFFQVLISVKILFWVQRFNISAISLIDFVVYIWLKSITKFPVLLVLFWIYVYRLIFDFWWLITGVKYSDDMHSLIIYHLNNNFRPICFIHFIIKIGVYDLYIIVYLNKISKLIQTLKLNLIIQYKHTFRKYTK